MKPETVKKLLYSEIERVANSPSDFVVNPQTDFTRNRKLPLRKMLSGVIGLGGGSLPNEIIDMFDCSEQSPTSSAFVQQRSKIKVEAFESIYRSFSKKIVAGFDLQMPVLAADGSDIQIATDTDDPATHFSYSDKRKGYNLIHLNALFDIEHGIYRDAVIQKGKILDEHKAFVEMVERSDIPTALVIADRGYESFNSMAHIQEKGWYYIIRIKDGRIGIKSGLDLPHSDSFDCQFSLRLTRNQSNETKELLKDKNLYKYISSSHVFDFLPVKRIRGEAAQFYPMEFRVVRFRISGDSYETVVTNLDAGTYPAEKLKELYSSRWGIETSFRNLKYTIGMLNFHSKKYASILQEIYARLIMYNFAKAVIAQIKISQKSGRHDYKINFSIAAHICRQFYRNIIKTLELEKIICRNLTSLRQGRHYARVPTAKPFHCFQYRMS